MLNSGRRRVQMSNLELKDKIALQSAPHVKGIIVEILKSGKYKVLLDRDWQTGRTMVYSPQELTLVN
tara:strand:+ start:279 stop:479 length:201 start_codon:yes stop_codon:yes gene_type:complete